MIDDLPKIPKFDLSATQDRQAWVAESLTARMSGEVNVNSAAQIAAHLNAAFDDDIPAQHIYDTIAQYQGRVVDPGLIHILSWQIAGRYDELRESPLALYTHPERAEWVPVEIIGVAKTTWKSSGRGVALHMRTLAGHPSGHTLVKKVPETWLAYLAYQVGFSKRMRYPDEPWVFVGLYFCGYLVPDEDTDQLSFEAWGMTDGMKKTNTAIIKPRIRFEFDKGIPKGFECPEDYDYFCNECPVRRTVCPSAINP